MGVGGSLIVANNVSVPTECFFSKNFRGFLKIFDQRRPYLVDNRAISYLKKNLNGHNFLTARAFDLISKLRATPLYPLSAESL